MSKYVVTPAGRENDEPFSNYVFNILQDGRKVAEISHDYRGDEHWMRLPDNKWIELAERVIEGGGPQSLTLSSAGVKAIDRLIA